MLLLSLQRGWSHTEPAEDLKIEHSPVVRLLDGLEGQGFVTRGPTEGDKRVTSIGLTAAAQTQVKVRTVLLKGIYETQFHIVLQVLQQAVRKTETASSRGAPRDGFL